MQNPDISPQLVASPLRGLLVAAIRGLGPEQRRPNGARQSDLRVAVGQDKQHPARTLDRILVEEHAAGTSLESALGIARAIRLGTLRLFGAIPDATDLSGAIHREQRAQCGVDPLQMRVAEGRATDADLELLAVRLEEQAEATTALELAVQVELAQRSARRQQTQRRIA